MTNMITIQRTLFATLVWSITIVAPVAAFDETEVAKALAQPILAEGLTQEEAQSFTEQKTPPMPEVSSRQQWESIANDLRKRVLERIVYRGEAAQWRDAETAVKWLDEIEGGPGYRIRKLRYEALPGLWIPALLYEPTELSSPAPVALNVNGHDAKGKAADYKQLRCINLAKRGVIALNVEWLGMGQLKGDDYGHYKMNQLDLCGTSGLAPFYLAMKRGLDILLAHEHADSRRVAVAGLSGGGWQTIIISSLDTRVTLSNPVAGYSSFRTRARHLKDLGDSEQTPCDLATIADYTHLTAMLAPRAALLTYNQKDNCCFEAPYALPPLLKAAEPIYKLYDKVNYLHSHINDDPGTHNFELDNRQALYAAMGEHFFEGGKAYSAKEIPSEKEAKTADQLNVPLPETNETFHSLAVAISKSLPKNAALPTKREAAQRWQQDSRKKLREIVRWRDYRAAVRKVDSAKENETSNDPKSVTQLQVVRRRFKFDDVWTAPVIEITLGAAQAAPPASKETVLLVGDEGRAALAKPALVQLKQGRRVLAIDPFYFGECKLPARDFLMALMVTTVGERPLGIQAGQLAAVARWAKKEFGGAIVLEAHGRRSSLFSLTAAAIETDAIDRMVLNDSFGSLKQIIEENLAVNQTPELFCFGLLEQFDILQLAALAAPTPITFTAPTERVEKVLAPLKEWNRTVARRQ